MMQNKLMKVMRESVLDVLKECETRYGVKCDDLRKEYALEEEEVFTLDAFAAPAPVPVMKVKEALEEVVVSPLTEPNETVPKKSKAKPKAKADDADAKRLEKAEKDAKKETKRLEDEAKKEAKRLEKEAKDAKKEAKRLEDEAKKEAKRLEKDAKKSEKKPREKKPRGKKETVVAAASLQEEVEEEEEEEDELDKVKINGKVFLQSTQTGILYDYDRFRVNAELVAVGKWSLTSNDPKEVEWMELADDEYESADE
jgi:DNA polymerase III alpha subunit (gram-positive type)